MPYVLATSERRQATILFADIAGFTRFSEGRDPEEVRALANEVFAVIGAVVERRGGTVDKYIGDCVMAVFGVPMTMRGSAAAAIDAAIDLRDQVAAKVGSDVSLHIGINTGEVVAGLVGSSGSQTYTVMGDAVNTASRIAHLCEPGEILIGEETWRATSGHFTTRALKPRAVKGKAQGLPTWAVESRNPAIAPDSKSWIDRGSSMARVLARLEERPDACLVLAKGGEGIGKSVFLDALGKVLERGGWRVRKLRGADFSSASSLSFGSMLLGAYGAVEIKESQENRPDASADAWLSDPAGPPTADELALAGLRFQERIRNALASRTDGERSVLVIDDLDLISSPGRELLEACLRGGLRDARPWIVASARSSAAVSMATRQVLGAEGLFETELQGLDEEGLAELLGAEGASFDRVWLRSLQHWSAGNPLLAELLAATDAGRPGPGRTGWIRFPRKGSISVEELAMMAVDRLDPVARETAFLAAACGKRFEASTLGCVCDSDPGPSLELLADAGIVDRDESSPVPAWRFRHPLFREVLHAALPKARRRDLHRSIARGLELSAAERPGPAMDVARHLGEAGEAGEALSWLDRAVGEARSLSGSGDVVEPLRAILESLDAIGPMEAESRRRPAEIALADALMNLDRLPEALALYDSALASSGFPTRKAGPAALPGLLLRMPIVRSRIRRLKPGRGRPIPASFEADLELHRRRQFCEMVHAPLRLLVEGLAVMGRAADHDLASLREPVSPLANLACGCLHFGWFDEASQMEEILLSSSSPTDRAGDFTWHYYRALSRLLVRPERERFSRADLDLGLVPGNLQYLGAVLRIRGYDAIACGDLETLADTLSYTASVATEIGNRDIEMVRRELLAWLAMSLEDAPLLDRFAKAGLAAARRADKPPVEAIMTVFLAGAALCRGDFDEARRLLASPGVSAVALRGQHAAIRIPWLSARLRVKAHDPGERGGIETELRQLLAASKRAALSRPKSLYFAAQACRARGMEDRARRFEEEGERLASARGQSWNLLRIGEKTAASSPAEVSRSVLLFEAAARELLERTEEGK